MGGWGGVAGRKLYGTFPLRVDGLTPAAGRWILTINRKQYAAALGGNFFGLTTAACRRISAQPFPCGATADVLGTSLRAGTAESLA